MNATPGTLNSSDTQYAYANQIHKFGRALIDRVSVYGPGLGDAKSDTLVNMCQPPEMEKIIKLFEAIIQRDEFYTTVWPHPCTL